MKAKSQQHYLAHGPVMNERGPLVAAVAALAFGLLVSVLATPYGLGVTPDSVIYLHAADSLRHGTGFCVPAYDGTPQPLTHYPPLYPGTIALVSHFGLDLMSAARAISLMLSAANITAVMVATYFF